MTRVLKTGLLLALVFGVVWLAVIIWWQESHTLPTGTDIGLYLFALPLALIAAGWAGTRVVRARREARAAPAGPAAAGDADAASAAPITPRLIVLASAARAAPGNDPQAIHAAVTEQQRPDLDTFLKNAKGFPIFSARAAHLDTEMLRDAAVQANAPQAAQAEDRMRATTLLSEVIQSLSQAARAHVLDGGTPERDDAWPLLQLELMLPADWPEAACDHVVEQARAATVWPSTRTTVRIHAAQDALASDSLLRQLAQEPLTSAIATMRLVAAADSYIDASQVQDWEAQGTLAGNATPQGRIPGEAAAGLLLDLAMAPAPGMPPPATDLAPPADALVLTLSPTAQRATRADARGAVMEPMLTAMATQFLDGHAQPADAIGALVSDADHRGSRPLEAVGLASALFPALDPNQDCLAVGAACGYTGAASHLLTLAVASEACTQSDSPVLAVLTQDPAQRTLTLVSRAPSLSA
ncbi:hypothetical protein [Achromobacter pestifer]